VLIYYVFYISKKKFTKGKDGKFFGQSGRPLLENGHFKNVQNAKPAPDFWQKK
jgi:hypothetical protein